MGPHLRALLLALIAAAVSASPDPAIAQCDSATFGGTISEIVPYSLSPLTALADFNGDGIPDLISSGGFCPTSCQDLLLLLGDGTGRFGPPTVVAVAYPKPPGMSGLASILVADFNGDGKPDIGLAYIDNGFPTTSGVAILLGDGQGGFGTPAYFLVGIRTYELAVGDFNGDGKLDLVARTQSGVGILLGDGAGGFGAPLFTSVGVPVDSGTKRLGVGDFNEDNKQDLMVVTGGLTLFPGDGTGHFGAPLDIPFTGARSLALGDFNKDSHLDVAVTPDDNGATRVYLGDGTGHFGAPTILPMTGSPILAVDLNGDGKLDVLVAGRTPSPFFEPVVSFFPGDGTGQFGPRVDYPTGDGPITFAVGDLDLDGGLDLVIGAFSQTEVLHSNGTGGFRRASPTRIAAGANIRAFSLATGDFNGDQKPDLVIPGTNNLSVFLGDGAGGFGAPILSAGYAGTTGPLAVADFNGDMKQDVVAVFPGNPGNQFALFLGDGSGGLAAPTYFSTPGSIDRIATADFNQDGKPDLVVTSIAIGMGTGTVSIYLGDGAGGFSSPTNYSLNGGADALTISDFNGDGRPDLAVLASQAFQPELAIFLATGPGTFGPPNVFTLNPQSGESVNQANGIVSGDFNGDGIPDLAVAALLGVFNQSAVLVLLGTGTGSFGPPLTFLLSDDSSSNGDLLTADFNGDGRLDLAAVASNHVTVLLGTGTGSFLPPAGFIAGYAPRALAVLDFNSDCKPDIVAVNDLTHDLSLFPNSCPAMFPSTVIAARTAVCASSTGNAATVPDAGPGSTYVWSITNGTITSGAGTRRVVFSAAATGPVGLSVTVTNAQGCASNGSASISVVACGAGTTGFYTVTPCRLIDTRGPAGDYGAPALQNGLNRNFSIAGQCGIAPTATAVAVNIVAVQPTGGPGFLTAYPGGTARPGVSTINYSAGQIRANNAIIPLGGAGDLSIYCRQGIGSANVVLDVTGYFQ